MTTSLHILVVGAVWPEPGTTAAGGRMLDLLSAMTEQGWQITFASSAAVGEHSANLADKGIRCETIALNCSSFDRQLASWQPDVVIFDRFMTEEQFGWRVSETCPTALRVLDTEDLHCLRAVRQGQLKTALKAGESGVPAASLDSLSLFNAITATDIGKREIAAIYRCDLSLIIARFEMDLLQNRFGIPDFLLHYYPLNAPAPLDPSPGFAERADFVSIGGFQHAPNRDAVIWLKQAIWPRIRQRLPHARVHICGAYAPQAIAELHRPDQGFIIRGRVEDAVAELARARVSLAPLRFGAGIKGKLLASMAAGTPSVTTSIGRESIAPEEAWPGRVADSAEALAEAAVTLHEEEDRWTAYQATGFELLADDFNCNHSAAFVTRLTKHLAESDHYRQQNFTGALLRHHHHQSTRYMARWIEEKNRQR